MPAAAAGIICTWQSKTVAQCNETGSNVIYTEKSISGNVMTLTANVGFCTSTLTVGTSQSSYKTTQNANINTGTQKGSLSCHPGQNQSAQFGKTYNQVFPPPPPGPGPGGGTSQTQSPDCSLDGDPMTWVLCPIFDAVSNASDWLFQNIVTPFLTTTPVQTNAKDPSFQVWSTFRIYGDIFLVIAVLVVVIGQAVGGGLVDAYTAKKVLPRILLTAILINLSVYIVAFLVDVTNIVGKSIGDILTQPFQSSHQWSFSPGAGASLGVFGAGLIGLLLTAGSITGVLAGLFFATKHGGLSGGKQFVAIALYAGLMVAIPILLSILAVFVTLVVRKGLILFLILISPIAFALYCLPATEKYFKKWWDLLFEALLVYPIIVAIFAVADILSVTILMANNIQPASLTPDKTGNISVGASPASILAVIVAFFLQFLPLFAVPFAFRMAGGTLSKAHEAIAGAHAKVGQMSKSRADEAKFQLGGRTLQARKDVDTGIRQFGDRHRWAKRIPGVGTNSLLARSVGRVGGRHIDYAMAGRLAEVQKREQQLTGNGADDIPRGATANKDFALSDQGKGAIQDSNGNWYAYDWDTTQGKHVQTSTRLTAADAARRDFTVGSDGSRTFRSAGGKQIAEWAVDEGHRYANGDQDLAQAFTAYEIKKSTSEEEQGRIAESIGNMGSTLNLGARASGAARIGAAYEQAGTDFDLKYFGQDAGSMKPAAVDKAYESFVTETNQLRGSYPMSQVKTRTIERLTSAWEHSQDQEDDARRALAAAPVGSADHKYYSDVIAAQQDRQRQIRETADTWSSRMPTAPAGSGGATIPTGGAGGVSAAMQELNTVVNGSGSRTRYSRTGV